jgi:hypothetical protein
MAQIRIRRNGGVFGKFAGLHVIVGGQKVATLREGEQRLLQDLEEGAGIYVELQGDVRSPTIQLSGTNTDFECGVNRWLAIDWLDFCYLPVLREHVFYLRPLTRQH